jgi:hypothetical protein
MRESRCTAQCVGGINVPLLRRKDVRLQSSQRKSRQRNCRCSGAASKAMTQMVGMSDWMIGRCQLMRSWRMQSVAMSDGRCDRTVEYRSVMRCCLRQRPVVHWTRMQRHWLSRQKAEPDAEECGENPPRESALSHAERKRIRTSTQAHVDRTGPAPLAAVRVVTRHRATRYRCRATSIHRSSLRRPCAACAKPSGPDER